MAKVLIVEDDSAILNSYAFILGKKGYQVYPTSNATEALKLASEQHPEVMIVDMLMPEMSGIEFLRQLQPKSNFPHSKIVVMSNTESPKIMEEASSLGADKYLLKVEHTPYTLADIVDELTR